MSRAELTDIYFREFTLSGWQLAAAAAVVALVAGLLWYVLRRK